MNTEIIDKVLEVSGEQEIGRVDQGLLFLVTSLVELFHS